MTPPGPPCQLIRVAAAVIALGLTHCDARTAAVPPEADAGVDGAHGDGAHGDGAAGDPLDRYLGGALLLPSFKAQHAAFSPALTRVALVRNNAGFSSELVLFDLRQTTSVTVAKDALWTEWIDEERLLVSAQQLGPATSRYRLELHDLKLAKATPLGEVCYHELTPDRKLVLAMRGDCDTTSPTNLEVRSLAPTGGWRAISKQVGGRFHVSPDSRLVTFTTGSLGCNGFLPAQLQLHDLTSKQTQLVHDGAVDSPRFMSDGRLLFRTCDQGGADKLMAFSAPAKAAIELAPKMTALVEWGPAECRGFNRYHVSSDAAHLLGGKDALLYRIPTDGKGPAVIASDLSTGSWRWKSFDLSHDGLHAVYVGKLGKGHTLSTVSVSGGAATTLASEPSRDSAGFDLSPVASEVTFLRRLDAARVQILRGPLDGGAAKVLHTATSIESASSIDVPPRFLPDGRAVLWSGMQDQQLLYIPGDGGKPTWLGRVEKPQLDCFGRLVDKTAKLVLFNSPGGVRLARLPHAS